MLHFGFGPSNDVVLRRSGLSWKRQNYCLRRSFVLMSLSDCYELLHNFTRNEFQRFSTFIWVCCWRGTTTTTTEMFFPLLSFRLLKWIGFSLLKRENLNVILFWSDWNNSSWNVKKFHDKQFVPNLSGFVIISAKQQKQFSFHLSVHNFDDFESLLFCFKFLLFCS